MKTRLSELEQLRLEKNKILAECKMYEEDLKYKIDYTKENFGSLLLNTVINSVKSGLSNLGNPFSSEPSKEKKPKSSSGIFSTISLVSPIIWQIIQPLLITLAVKKLKSKFFKKTKK